MHPTTRLGHGPDSDAISVSDRRSWSREKWDWGRDLILKVSIPILTSKPKNQKKKIKKNLSISHSRWQWWGCSGSGEEAMVRYTMG